MVLPVGMWKQLRACVRAGALLAVIFKLIMGTAQHGTTLEKIVTVEAEHSTAESLCKKHSESSHPVNV